MICKSALCTCLLLGAAIAAMGQSRQESLNNCRSVDLDVKITGCTALIQAGQDTTENLSVIYNNRGTAYDDKGDYDRAIQDFNEAIRLNPNFERAYYDRGNAYIDKDDYDRAIQEYDEAIRLNPKDANAYNNRGVAYERKGDYGHAIQDYNQAILLNSNYTSAYSGRGSAYFAQSNLTAAIADFLHTISAAPSSSGAVYAVLMLHVIMKRQGHDDAQQLARVATATDLSKWPGPVLKLDMGQMTANEVMMAAVSPGSDRQKKWQVCEAHYFTGEDALIHHQRATALAELKRLGASAAPTK